MSTYTAEEVMESLSHFDEIAIEHAWGIDVYTDSERKPVRFLRALVFVMKRRTGLSDADAANAVKAMTLKDVNAQFSDDTATDESGESVAGKDAPPPTVVPVSELSSVSTPAPLGTPTPL